MAPPPRIAVILAAGMGTRLGADFRSQPKGFLRLGQRPIIEESVEKLRRAGIDRIIIATGHCREYYEDFARNSGGLIQTVHNPRYSESGSLYSLYLLREQIDGDFLLLESDLIYEQRALTSAIEFPRDNCVLLSGFTGSGDEVFVELAAGRLVDMSKDRNELGEISGELVGITKISTALFEQMLATAEDLFLDSMDQESVPPVPGLRPPRRRPPVGRDRRCGPSRAGTRTNLSSNSPGRRTGINKVNFNRARSKGEVRRNAGSRTQHTRMKRL